MNPMSAATTTPTTPTSPSARRRLPFTLYALAGLVAVKALLLLAVVAGANMENIRAILGFSNMTGFLDAVRANPLTSSVLLVLAVLLLFSVVGILSRRRIGWLLAMVITGLFVAFDIYGFLNNAANHLWMGLNILTVFYLNQQDVREAVGAATSSAADDAEGIIA
jgi:hypothetical protein